MERRGNLGFCFLLMFFLTACTVGPNYKRPIIEIPAHFKEAAKGWKVAQPRDDLKRGEWWKIFHDDQLSALELGLNGSNQSIAAAAANYQQALSLVNEARASYFPTLSNSTVLTRQKRAAFSGTTFNSTSNSSTSTFSSSGTSPGGTQVSTFHSLLLNASWEPDLWGSIHRTVEASVAGAQASAALLATTRLSSQSSLAQYYFELRAIDNDQKLLDDTVVNYKKSLTLVTNQYHSGVASRADIVLAQSQLESAQALAINNGITRAQYEHAIAVLIGQPPEIFSIPFQPKNTTPPSIPLQVPSIWLERRPDIAQAERLMAQANEQIGIAIAAYFPTITLNASASYAHPNYNNWLSIPGAGWTLGPQLAELLLDGGLRKAAIAAAKAGYQSTAASYRQTILTAFQDVEDNLAALRILGKQAHVENQAVSSARLALKLEINQYQAGTIDYASVIAAQTTLFQTEKTAADVNSLRMTATVGLIKALGGGWDASSLD